MNSTYEREFSPSFPQQTVVDCLAENTPFSKQQLKRFMQQGSVWLQSEKQPKPVRVRRAKKLLSSNDKVFFYHNPAVLSTEITPPTLIADEQSFSIWYKPKGVLCQGSKWGDHTTINRWIETHYQFNGQTRNAIIVHRLDKATDGLIIIAHHKQTAKQLTQAFEARQLNKTYQATVIGHFKNNCTFNDDLEGKTAITHAEFLSYDAGKNQSVLSINIETGRKHQIRIHLSQAGFPIVGDRLYGLPQDPSIKTTLPDLQLTATQLSLCLNQQNYHFKLDCSLQHEIKF